MSNHTDTELSVTVSDNWIVVFVPNKHGRQSATCTANMLCNFCWKGKKRSSLIWCWHETFVLFTIFSSISNLFACHFPLPLCIYRYVSLVWHTSDIFNHWCQSQMSHMFKIILMAVTGYEDFRLDSLHITHCMILSADCHHHLTLEQISSISV